MKTNLAIEFEDIKYEAVRLVGWSDSTEIRFNDNGTCFCHYHRFTLGDYLDRTPFPLTIIVCNTKNYTKAILYDTEFNEQGIAVKTRLELAS